MSGAAMVRYRLAAVRDHLREIWELGERLAKAENLPLSERLYWAGQAVAAGKVLECLLDDNGFSGRLWEFWRYAGGLERELKQLEREREQGQK
jgi:hypothetical protein